MSDRRIKHDEHIAAEVAWQYRNGNKSVREIAEHHGVPPSTNYTLLDRVGIRPDRKRTPVAVTHDDDLYDITVEQEFIIANATEEIDSLRAVLDRGD